jgi:mRNA interferase MazF
MKEGDVVLTRFRQADGNFKNRPAIILCTVPPFGDFLVCAVSTQLRHRVPDFDEVITISDADFASSGLKQDSLIRIGYLASLPASELVGDIGEISTERHRGLVRRLAKFLNQFVTATDSQIDETIMATLDDRFHKVAMIISKVADKLRTQLPLGEEGYHMIAERIQSLAAEGKVASQGNLARWRYSEIKLP